MDETTPPTGAPEDPQKDPDPTMGAAIEFLTLGIAAALSLVAGGGIGYLIDDWAGTSPWFTLIGLVFGIVCAVLLVVSRVRRLL
ncbi:MAG: AtpZ/AtpI family protein [Acidimicrobiales bacterium]